VGGLWNDSTITANEIRLHLVIAIINRANSDKEEIPYKDLRLVCQHLMTTLTYGLCGIKRLTFLPNWARGF